MRRFNCCLLLVGLTALALCGGCVASASGTAADGSSLDAIAGQMQTFVLDFVRQMLAAVMM